MSICLKIVHMFVFKCINSDCKAGPNVLCTRWTHLNLIKFMCNTEHTVSSCTKCLASVLLWKWGYREVGLPRKTALGRKLSGCCENLALKRLAWMGGVRDRSCFFLCAADLKKFAASKPSHRFYLRPFCWFSLSNSGFFYTQFGFLSFFCSVSRLTIFPSRT